MNNILIILGHPHTESLNNALAEKYAEGARAAGHEVRLLKLGQLQFDPILRHGYSKRQELEPDLQAAWEDILWCNHLVLLFPTWWGVTPALLKGFFDRLFLPGLAFKYKPDSPWWDKYLTGRSARIITTMDTPVFYNALIYRNANIRSVKTATLEYCGIKPVRVTKFGSVRFADDKRRKKMLDTVYALGEKSR